MATALAKPIRLRNETFTPPAPDRAKPIQTHALEQPVTGLFLVQFAGVPTNDTLQQLRALNADILRSVPEDAFVVRLRGVRLSRVRGLPFIRWVGEYQPAWKVDSALLNRPAVAPPKAPELVRLKILAAPQAEPELAPLRAMFAAIPKQSATRFGTIIEGAIEPANLNRLAASDAVLWIERAPHPKLFDEVSTRIVAGEPEETEPGGTNGTFVHQLGYDGSGVTVAVADSGLHNGDDGTMHPDLEGRVSAFFHYGTLEDGSDEHGHGTHVSGIIAGNAALGERDETGLLYGLGVAPGAHIISQRIFDGIGNYEAPPSFEKLTRDAVRAGAYVGSNSWGDDTHGRYDLSAAEFDALVRDADAETPGDQPYVLEFSAGNAGPASHTIGSPAVAKNVIATGASQNNRVEFFIYTEGQETMADFSSRGPCEDGRIKPDVVAPGTWIASLQSGSATDENAWLTISPNYQYQGGTSQSGPHASGAAAVFIQYYRETFGGSTPSPALVKAALINSAVELDDPTDTLPSPNHDEGWGRIDLTEMVSELRTFEYLDQSVLLTTGQMYERRFLVGNGFDPLKATLVYTDVPGFPATLPALVNNLDLEIVAPDGQVYHGNQFVDGESTPNPTENDNINNVEGVHLARPLPGEYLLRIRARKVIEDSRRDTAAIDQDFALVISGDLPLPGTGLVTLDRRAYSAPATVQMKVIDYDLAGRPSVNVLIKSSTESGGEPLVLNSVDPRGIFSGAISTATGVASADGILQIRHDDTIEVSYIDAAPAETRLATARVDLMPPVISSVTSTNEFGQIVIRWETDELATSQVRFGANDVLDNLVASSRFVTFHEMTLAGLRVGTRYEYEVTSVDEAGNAATDNNRGQNYEFVPAPAATILLVDGFQDPLLEIPITGYTEALDRIGVSYEIWDLTVKEAPTAAQMKPFRVVLWRLPEFNQTPLTAAEQSALREYLEKGGAVFLASMELLSRLDSGGFQSFRKEVLQVEDFDEDVEVPTILGVEGDPIGSGIDLALDYTEYDIFGGFFGPDFSDTFMPSTNAVPILIEPGSGKPAGLRYPKTGKDSKGRLVFFSFPLEAVPDADPSPNNRHNLLLNVLRFLAPGLNGLSTLALDSPAYTTPSVVTVELADSDLVDRTEIEVKAFNFSSGEEQRIKLFSTATPGLFRGTFNLSGSASPPGSGTIQAGENDSVGVEYFDESVPAEIRASAMIDTRPPTISDVFAEAEYQEATVSWSTSEPADALVQFGESTFLGRTAYAGQLSTSHELLINGLLPDRQYYYQVVSRDTAGNVVTDNNQGRFYTFRTLKPLLPPWFDDLENGATNWVVFSDEINDDEVFIEGVAWQHGPPENGLEISAHSPTHVWGTNLKGDPVDFGLTDLIGPAIELMGGNRATLKFWHSYDFTERSEDFDYEIGQVYVSTNNGAAWTLLATYDDVSSGWEEEEINLTPYLGKVIRLGWHYELLSFETVSRPGWMIDDVSVTVTNILQGIVQVANNLSQAKFTIAGPLSIQGQGFSFIMKEAPPGDYTITFQAVPYYQTPPSLTRMLAPDAIITFNGDYTFADANQNGISDEWEQQFFGEISPQRTGTTDTDGDGSPDLTEFIAGTNPNDPEASLQLLPPEILANGPVRLKWTSSPGRSYRVLGTNNLRDWAPYSGWIRAESNSLSHQLPALTSPAPYFFRVEVVP